MDFAELVARQVEFLRRMNASTFAHYNSLRTFVSQLGEELGEGDFARKVIVLTALVNIAALSEVIAHEERLL